MKADQSGSGLISIRHDFQADRPPRRWPSVSLCMIVRDEEKHLAACLDSVRGLVSEMIIVDTGSSDRTVEIARAYGAEVRFFPWINDFAAARNESIRGAKGKWILWMDADDRLTAEGVEQAKCALLSGLAQVYAFRVVSPVAGNGQPNITVHRRLFMNGLGLHFEGAVHERLVRGPHYSGTITTCETNIVVEHVGYRVDAETMKAKARRNLEITRACLERDPGSAYYQRHLGSASYILEDYETAARAFQQVLDNNWDELAPFEIVGAHVLLVSSLQRLGRHEEALRVAELTVQRFPDVQDAWATLASCHIGFRRWSEAQADLERALAIEPDPVRCPSRLPLGGVQRDAALVYLVQGQLDKARQVFVDWVKQARAEGTLQPVDESVMTAARQHLEQGNPRAAIAALEPVAMGDSAASRLLARARLQAGEVPGTFALLAAAALLDGFRPGDLFELASVAFRSGDRDTARRLCQYSLQREGRSEAVCSVLGTIAALSNDADEAFRWFSQALMLNPKSRQARANLAQVAAVAGMSESDVLCREAARLMAEDSTAEAVSAIGLALEYDEDNAQAWKLLATAMQRLGRDDDAVLCAKRALELAGQAAG
jgi:tetratricopeptide (TPR) repeat protein